jgi:hypothetical protein
MADEDFQRILQTQRLSEQNMQNFSFDSEFQCLFTEIAGYDKSTDSLKRIAVDSLGRIVISPSGSISESVWEYGFQNTVADNSVTTLLTYVVTGSDLFLDKIMATGLVDAEYQVLVDGSIKAKYMTSEQDRVAKFDFPVAQEIAVGGIIAIKVIHFRSGIIADFNCSLIGHK